MEYSFFFQTKNFTNFNYSEVNFFFIDRQFKGMSVGNNVIQTLNGFKEKVSL